MTTKRKEGDKAKGRKVHLPYPELLDPNKAGGDYTIVETELGDRIVAATDTSNRVLYVPLDDRLRGIQRHEQAHVKWSGPECNHGLEGIRRDTLKHTVLNVEDVAVNGGLERRGIPLEMPEELSEIARDLATMEMEGGQTERAVLRCLAASHTSDEQWAREMIEREAPDYLGLYLNARAKLDKARKHREGRGEVPIFDQVMRVSRWLEKELRLKFEERNREPEGSESGEGEGGEGADGNTGSGGEGGDGEGEGQGGEGEGEKGADGKGKRGPSPKWNKPEGDFTPGGGVGSCPTCEAHEHLEHRLGKEDREERRTKGGTGGGYQRTPVRFKYPPLVVPCGLAKMGGRQKRNREIGIRLGQVYRSSTDGRIFKRTIRNQDQGKGGGSVLFDCSGSMRIRPAHVERIANASPKRTVVATYEGGHEFGEVTLLADRGMHANAEGMRGIGRFGGNEIDLPALQWLAEQPKPRIWVSDGYVCGGGMDDSKLVEECNKVCEAAGIIRVDHVEAAVRVMTEGVAEEDIAKTQNNWARDY